jgi:hypothetical protein
MSPAAAAARQTLQMRRGARDPCIPWRSLTDGFAMTSAGEKNDSDDDLIVQPRALISEPRTPKTEMQVFTFTS